MAENTSPRLIVGIGASAGGLEALGEFFEAIPGDSGMAFVVVQNLSPDGCSLLTEMLAKTASIDVVEITDGLALEPNRLYVAPSQTLVNLRGSDLQVQPTSNADQAVIDHFLFSLAEQPPERSVGIVLSGAGTDGTLGLKAVNDAGGMTIAQSFESAQYDSMPRNAAATGVVDHVLTPSEMPQELLAYADSLRETDADFAEEVSETIRQALPAISEILQRETTHDFQHYKTSTLVRRVRRRMRVLHLSSVENYLQELRGNRGESNALFRELLISVTTFFRDPDAFAALIETALAQLFDERSPEEQIRIWVPGCASGEEAYSLAMLLREEMSRRGKDFQAQIFATDIDERALQIARQGAYPIGIAEDVSPERLDRFFVKRGNRYHVTRDIRELCLFSHHNLISDPPFSRQDLISCRNLLIYLGPHLQKKLIPLFHYALRPGGYLFLGPSENITSHAELFRVLDSKHRISQAKASAARSATELESRETQLDIQKTTATADNSGDLTQVMQRIVLDEFAPQCVVVDDEGRVVCASGDMSRYLSVGGGNFQNNIVRMARVGLRVGLRAALSESRKTRRRVVHQKLSIRVDGAVQPLTLTVQPMPQVGEGSELFLVVFQDRGPAVQAESSGHADHATDSDTLIEQLETELRSTREDLEKSVQDIEAANEELKSSNEELLSMNEELQSANEELESSKEEIEAAHDALSQTHADLENLLRNTAIAVVFLDNDLNIRRFTPAAAQIYNLISTDVGRPLSHQTHRALEMPPLPDVKQLFETGERVEHSLRTQQGRWYIRRVRPYRTHTGENDGVVVTFTDVTELQESERRFRRMADDAPVMIWIGGKDKKPTWFNKPLREFLGRSIEEVAQDGFEADVHPGDVERRRQIFVEAFEARQRFTMEYRLRRKDGEYRWLLDSGTPEFVGTDFVGYIGSCIDITDRKRAEQHARHLANIVESSNEVIIGKTLEGIITSWNRAAEKTYGYTAEEAVGQSIELIIPPEHRAHVATFYDRLRKGQVIEPLETTRVTKDNRLLDVWLTVSPVIDEAGRVTGASALARDITRRKKAERELIESRQQLQLITDSVPAAVAYVNLQERYEFVNNGYALQFGAEKQDIVGRTAREVLGESNYEQAAPHLKAALAGERRTFELRLQSHSGDVADADVDVKDVTYVPHERPDGSIAGCHVLVVDVTQRTRMTQTLSESEERSRLAAEFADFGLYDADLLSGNVYWSDTLKKLLGLTAESPASARADEIPEAVHPQDRNRLLAAVRRSFAPSRGGRIDHEHRIVRPDGSTRWLHVRGRTVFEGRGAKKRAIRAVGTVLDVTKRKRLEEALVEAKQLADDANRSKSEFLANMSHEIRTPMSAILGYSELLADHLSDPDDLQCVETIRRNGHYLLEIINDILDLSRIEAGKFSLELLRVRPDVLVSEVHSLMAVRAAEKGLPLDVEFDGPVPETIETDPIRLRQILVNLVGNAIKFTESGSVRLVTRLLRDERRLQFDIIDTGIGIPPDRQTKLFEPFSQGDASVTRQFGGSGLGLSISRRLAESLGGEIGLESRLGEGSRFTVQVSTGDLTDVPLVEPRQDVPQPLRHAPSRQLTCRVLVADDRREVRHLAQHFLEEAGADVIAARDGKEALEKARKAAQRGQRIDLVLMDMQMPKMDGYETTIQLRSLGFEQPIIALTAHAMKGDAEKCMEAGCDDYETKPIDGSRLVDVVARYTQDISLPELRARRLQSVQSGEPESENKPNDVELGEKLLIVDDSTDACQMLKLLLENCGHGVVVAHDGRSAIDRALEHRPRAILLDLTLPDISGFEVARQLRQTDETKQVVLIAVSGHGSPEDRQKSRQAGFDHHLQKPVDLESLQGLLAREPESY